MERDPALQKIRNNPACSVLIIGAGVNGISAFRELALQGIDVVMVDKGDFCSGASAASSHMAHGGLRYLENGEFRLVREALTERNRLLKNAPHYVQPLPTTIPIFHWFSGILNAPLKFVGLSNKPSNRGALIIKLGLTLYDIFARNERSMPRHRIISRKKSLELRPHLSADIVCTAQYYDAWISAPERLCVEMILDAEKQNPDAVALNYMAVADGEGDHVVLQDEVTSETFTIQPRVVINAGGPWIDFVNRRLDYKTTFIGGTKGSHIVIDHPELYKATAGSEMFFENKDGRITLFLPYLDKVMAGTTDIPIEDPDEAVCTEEEVDYILESIRQVFPNMAVDRSHIVFRFSGVRPLPASDADNPGQISRDHSIKTIEPDDDLEFPVYSLVGGKWTTFRAFGEQIADVVLEQLGVARKVDTVDLPIGGGTNYPRDTSERVKWLGELQTRTGLSETQIATLFQRYGTRAEEIAEYLIIDEDRPLETLPDFTRREVLFLATYEGVVHLDDFLLRRSLVGMLGRANRAMLEELAAIFADAQAWDQQRQSMEVEHTANLLKNQHKITL